MPNEDLSKAELGAEITAMAEAEDFDGIVDLVLTLVVRNNPAYAAFYPLARRLLRGAFGKIRSKAEGESRWFNPFSWF